MKRLSNNDILSAQPPQQDLVEELAWWERNQFKLCILEENPEPPPNIPELKGLLDYFIESRDYYAVARRIGQLKRIVKIIDP